MLLNNHFHCTGRPVTPYKIHTSCPKGTCARLSWGRGKMAHSVMPLFFFQGQERSEQSYSYFNVLRDPPAKLPPRFQIRGQNWYRKGKKWTYLNLDNITRTPYSSIFKKSFAFVTSSSDYCNDVSFILPSRVTGMLTGLPVSSDTNIQLWLGAKHSY